MNEIFWTPAARFQRKPGPFALILLLLVLLGLSLSAGCGQHEIQGCAVSGHVMLNGNPLPDGTIMFMPQTPAPGLKTLSTEITSGEFSIPPSSALMPGTYRVAITAQRKTGRKIRADEGSSEMVDEREEYMPPKYNSQTTLSAEISGDTDQLEFPLQIP